MYPHYEILGDPDGRPATVVVNNVSKTYRVGKQRIPIGLLKPKDSKAPVTALSSVSFVSYAGDSVGVIGHNGSGKSTLLRIIAGGENPTEGEVLVSSRPTLLGISAALQPHLSGAKNVELGCLAMGMMPEEVRSVYESIVDFSGLGKDINRPMKTYSSGMGSRLRFAIATARAPEILIIDEALGAGDAEFAKKSSERMSAMLANAGTVFIVSHSPTVVARNCNRAIWLHQGRIIQDGFPKDVTTAYTSWSKLKSDNKHQEAEEMIKLVSTQYSPPNLTYL